MLKMIALNIANSLDNYITGSINGGSDDFTLVDAKGTFFNYGGTDNNSQGAFLNPSVNVMSQNIYFWVMILELTINLQKTYIRKILVLIM